MKTFSYEANEYNRKYMTKQPNRKDAIGAASIEGKVVVLPNSYNKAITIETNHKIFLQSYDTIILSKDKRTGRINKMWNGYTKTTLKHINEFLGTYMNKAEWMAFNGG